jgi:DNA repair exonuclease SbcCD nuclease subunit
MSILFFADTHFGLKTYSTQDSNGKFTSELDVMNALEFIYERAKQDDITMLIHGGDFFHSPHPTTSNIKWVISWLQRIEYLNKPFYIIVGNHDASNYSNSMVFIKELNFKNIHLIDSYDKNFTIPFGKYTIKFAPYVMNLSMKEKDVIAHSNFMECIEESNDNTIIVSHIQETSCKIGSEARMISKGVDVLNVESPKNIILLLGHIHRNQLYKKGNVTICYSGSTTYNDAGDVGMLKGYYIVDTEGNLTFENITNIRIFKKYELSKTDNTIEYFTNKKMAKNQVAFIEHYDDVDISKLTELFKSINSIIGWTKKQKEIKLLNTIEISVNSSDSYEMFREFATKKFELSTEYKQEFKDRIINEGIKFMNTYIGKKDE